MTTDGSSGFEAMEASEHELDDSIPGAIAPESKRSYGCSFGDGNPYDYIMVDAQSGDALFVCVPCFIKQAMTMVETFLNSDTPESEAALAMMEASQASQVPGPSGRKRGHNAPAGPYGEALFDTYEDRILPNELPPEFR